jgi:hypothetical protein
LDRLVKSCAHVLAVIGPQWSPTRLHDASDLVRFELTTALDLGIPVVPVLRAPAPLPVTKDLPSELRPLLDHQAFVIAPDPDFHDTAEELAAFLDQSSVGDGLRDVPGRPSPPVS